MTRHQIRKALVLLLVVHGPVFAQNAATLADGKAFAESIAPQTPGQIVNPAGVNPGSWSTGSTAMPSVTPPGLGAFSSPLTSSPLFDSLGAQGALAGLANTKIQDCRNYVPTGDPIADQECAAVKYMNKDCVPLTSSQTQVVGTVGVPHGAPYSCADTYGAGASGFAYRDAITATDPVFHLSQNAQHNATAVTPQTCVSTPVVTRPAQYETNTCSKMVTTNQHTCTKELAVAITTSFSPATPSYRCEGGTLQGQYCIRTRTNPASVTYTCPSGTLSGTLCVNTTETPASLSYTCPDGGVLSGTTCTGQSLIPADPKWSCTVGRLEGDQCVSEYEGTVTYSCWLGSEDRGDGRCWFGSPNLVPGADCRYYGSIVGYICSAPQERTVSCPDGGTVSGNSCVTTTTATLNYQCSQGSLSGSNCIVDINGPAVAVYSCESGTLQGTQCITTRSDPALREFHCPPGQTLNGEVCEEKTTSLADIHYSCPSGVAPVGNQCKSVLVQKNWINNCLPYELSAGLPTGAR